MANHGYRSSFHAHQAQEYVHPHATIFGKPILDDRNTSTEIPEKDHREEYAGNMSRQESDTMAIQTY